MSASHFKQLEVWRLAMDLARATYEHTATFPREERYGLCAQMQRAAVSIPSNIAEGNARRSRRDYARFVGMAMGSAAELHTQLLLGGELGLGDESGRERALGLCDRVGQMLFKLHQALDANPGPGSRVPGPETVQAQ